MDTTKAIIQSTLEPIYSQLTRRGQIINVTIPSGEGAEEHEQILHFHYRNGYVACYFVDENAEYVKVGNTLPAVVDYLMNNYAANRLINLKVGSVD